MIERRFAPLEYRAEAGRVEGVAMQYGTIADIGGAFRERFEAGAFGDVAALDVLANVQHDATELLARTQGGGLTLTDSADALRAAIDLPPDAGRGGCGGTVGPPCPARFLSVEFRAIRERFEAGGLRIVERADLRGLGIVAPARVWRRAGADRQAMPRGDRGGHKRPAAVRPMKWPKLWPMGQDRRAEGEPLPPELEEQEAQTDPLVAALLGRTWGAKADPQQLAAVEASAGLVARAFALAELVPATPATSAVTPALLEMVGRAFIARGELVAVLEADPMDGLALHPASYWDVRGSYRPASWRYRANLAGPSRLATVSRASRRGRTLPH